MVHSSRNGIGSFFQEGPVGQEGGAYARLAKPVPCEVGVQVTRRDHTEVPPKSLLRKIASDWADPARVVSSTRDRADGRSRDARPCAPVSEHTAEVQRGARDRVSQRKECSPDPSGVTSRASDDGTPLLVNGVLACSPKTGPANKGDSG